jgi:hypothetical protein
MDTYGWLVMSILFACLCGAIARIIVLQKEAETRAEKIMEIIDKLFADQVLVQKSKTNAEPQGEPLAGLGIGPHSPTGEAAQGAQARGSAASDAAFRRGGLA